MSSTNLSIVILAFTIPLLGLSLAPAEEPVTTASLEQVATFDGPMPTGVTVSHSGRIFVNFPRWGDDVNFTVAELKDGKAVAYPNQDFNTTPSIDNQAAALVSVQSVVVDPKDRLWALDTGAIKLGPTSPGGPKLVCFDLADDKVTTTILVPPDVALRTSYLNDIRFDLRPKPGYPDGVAYVTDSASSGPAAIISVNLATGKSSRRLSGDASVEPDPGFVPIVEGKPLLKQPSPQARPEIPKMGADGIAISSNGERLYYCPLISRNLYSVATSAILPDSASENPQVKKERGRPGAADGLQSDAEGNLYFTDYEHHSIIKRLNGKDTVVAVLPTKYWPDTLSISDDGYLYIMANELQRQKTYNLGQDKREKPYILYRIKINATPVRLGGSAAAQ